MEPSVASVSHSHIRCVFQGKTCFKTSSSKLCYYSGHSAYPLLYVKSNYKSKYV